MRKRVFGVRGTSLAVANLLLAGVLALHPSAATAVSGLPKSPGATYQTNGRVAAILPIGDVVYVAGSFTAVRPSGAALGTSSVTRNRLAAFNRDTGALLPWNPNADKDVYALASSADGTTIYAGGAFGSVGGSVRKRVAAIDRITGALKPWAPAATGKVYALAVTSSRVYLGGTLTAVNGQPRTRLAAVSLTGALDATWTPEPDDTVRALAVSADGASIYVGGQFIRVDGDVYGKHFVNLDPVTGALKTWWWRPGYDVWAISVATDRVYLAGNGSGGHVAAHSLPMGGKIWQVQSDGGMQTLAVLGGVVYAGGHMDNMCTDDTLGGTLGFECPTVLAVRHKLVALDAASGALDPWNPGANSDLGVFALTASGGRLQVGGDFSILGGKSQQGYGQFG